MRIVNASVQGSLQDTCSDLGAVGGARATAEAEIALSRTCRTFFSRPRNARPSHSSFSDSARDGVRRAASTMNGASAPRMVKVTGGHYRHTHEAYCPRFNEAVIPIDCKHKRQRAISVGSEAFCFPQR
jgi:hypothetical protein